MAILKLLQRVIINRLYVNTNKKIESHSREIKATETNWNFKIKKYSNTKHPKKTKILWDGLNLGWRGQKNQWIWRSKKKKKGSYLTWISERKSMGKKNRSSTSDTVTKDLMSVSSESQERGGKM